MIVEAAPVVQRHAGQTFTATCQKLRPGNYCTADGWAVNSVCGHRSLFDQSIRKQVSRATM